MAKVLIVEDEQHLADGLRFNLEAEGHEVAIAKDGESALEQLKLGRNGFDAVVLDVMLPGVSGFDVASRLRAKSNFVPILMLTARGRPEDVLRGFEAGADDYLSKPFDLNILLARVRSLLRRSRWSRPPQAEGALPADDTQTYTFAGKSVDFAALELRVGKKTHRLTVMEIELLRYLIRNQGKPVSRRALLEEVWGLREDTDTRAIDNFIVRLRRYIERFPSAPKHLLTVRGVGYKFVPDPE